MDYYRAKNAEKDILRMFELVDEDGDIRYGFETINDAFDKLQELCEDVSPEGKELAEFLEFEDFVCWMCIDDIRRVLESSRYQVSFCGMNKSSQEGIISSVAGFIEDTLDIANADAEEREAIISHALRSFIAEGWDNDD